ncbi:MAG: hypothetical protein NTU53_09615 [Planctomycetota bacterium]|nr:hypothetical protein [Planctomycetota bacterium]
MLAADLHAAAGGSADPPAAVPGQIKELEEAILSHRRAIATGHFRIKYFYIDNQTGRRTDWVLTTYFDPLRVREEEKNGDVVTTQIFGDEHYYWYCDKKLPNSKGYALVMKDAADVQRSVDCYPHEPLKLMFHPLGYRAGHKINLEYFVGSAARIDLRAAQVTWEGQQAWKVSFSTKAGSQVAYWAVPSYGYSIVRMEKTWKSDLTGPHSDAVQCTVQHVRDDIWFPKTVHYVGTMGGKQVRQQDLDIEVVSVNRSIDPRLFEPITLNVPPDTLVARVPRNPRGTLIWNGKEVVVATEEDIVRQMAGVRSGSTLRRMILLGISLLFAIAGGVVLWRRYLRTPAGTSR